MSPVAARREAIIAAVDTYNRANPLVPLPRSAARLLAVMFTGDDTCQQSLDARLDASGVSRPTAQSVLRTLLVAGVIAREEKGHGRHANRYRLQLALGADA